jgi:hypothetical protein
VNALGISFKGERRSDTNHRHSKHRTDYREDGHSTVSCECSGNRTHRWPFRPISGVIATPTIRPDGSLLAVPGYDKVCG